MILSKPESEPLFAFAFFFFFFVQGLVLFLLLWFIKVLTLCECCCVFLKIVQIFVKSHMDIVLIITN